MERYIQNTVLKDLQSKMVFVGGPRQVGKTTFAKSLLPPSPEGICYFNWDFAQHRKIILQQELPSTQKLIVLDEIHKFAKWRSLVKGHFDLYGPKSNILATGSARMDYYRKGGDSLQGRYHYYRLHPLSINELNIQNKNDIQSLLKFGGFPEPFFSQDETAWRRWQRERIERVMSGDLRDLERVNDVSLVELLVENLPSKVGSPLSIKNLREDLEVSHASVDKWIGILERLYMCFRISPFGAPKIRAVKKEQKLYLWDWSQVEDEGSRFENMVACMLLKYCHWLEDTQGYKMELRYLRDIDKREVDFVVIQNKKPVFAVEAKLNSSQLSDHLKYFKERTNIAKFFQVHLGDKHFGNEEVNGRLIPIIDFCKEMNLK